MTRICDQIETLRGGSTVRVASKRVSLLYAGLPDRETLVELVRRGGGVTSEWHLNTDGTEFGEAVRAELVLERMGSAPPPRSIQVEVQAIRVGDFCVVGIAGEVFTEIGLQIEEAAPGPVLMLGTTNGNAGYICTEESYTDGGYEPSYSWMLYTHPAPFLPVNERLIIEAGRAVVSELFN